MTGLPLVIKVDLGLAKPFADYDSELNLINLHFSDAYWSVAGDYKIRVKVYYDKLQTDDASKEDEGFNWQLSQEKWSDWLSAELNLTFTLRL